MALSATRVKALKEPGRYSDGAGLHLYVNKAGGKSWVLRITIEGRRRDIGLGGFPSVSLAQCSREGGGPPGRRCRGSRPPGREARACDADFQRSRPGRP